MQTVSSILIRIQIPVAGDKILASRNRSTASPVLFRFHRMHCVAVKCYHALKFNVAVHLRFLKGAVLMFGYMWSE